MPASPSRRSVLRASAGLAGAALAGALPLDRAWAQAAPPPQTIVLPGSAFGIGTYNYHPFTVPAGVNRIDVKIIKAGSAVTGLALFDFRGAGYQSAGFRGLYGEERGEFFVAADAASQSFLPGPMDAGTWTVVVPIFRAPVFTPYEIFVTLSFGDRGIWGGYGPGPGVVRATPGWYRGDLHCHTPESSDAFNSRTALTPTAWGDECRRIGLDFVALTDHNTISQHIGIAAAAGQGVLLMPGEEMTNFFHGHATVSGIDPGEWFDFRQRPLGLPVDPAHEARIKDFLVAARAADAFVSVAHPLGAVLKWDFFPEAATDPAARTDSLEVWTGPFQPDDQASVDAWDAMNRAGQRLVANGGSDLHGTGNTQGFMSGTPTTVVHAAKLAQPEIIAALRKGRSFITKRPDRVEVYLAVRGPGGQRQIPGGTVFGAPTDAVEIEAVVRRAGGMRLVLLRDGAVVSTTPLTSDDQTVTATQPIGAGGFVRLEVRGVPFLAPNPIASTLDMEALTNPVWLAVGAPPADGFDPTQPPPNGPGAIVPEVPLASLLPVAALGTVGVGYALSRHHARQPDEDPGPQPLTLPEWSLLARSGMAPEGEVRLVGEVTAVLASTVVLSVTTPGCCSSEEDVHVPVRHWPGEPPELGTTWEVDGHTEDEQLLAVRARPLP